MLELKKHSLVSQICFGYGPGWCNDFIVKVDLILRFVLHFWVSIFCSICLDRWWLVPLELLGYPMVKLEVLKNGSTGFKSMLVIQCPCGSAGLFKSCNMALLWLQSKQSMPGTELYWTQSLLDFCWLAWETDNLIFEMFLIWLIWILFSFWEIRLPC